MPKPFLQRRVDSHGRHPQGIGEDGGRDNG
jgi:hypothetical protein